MNNRWEFDPESFGGQPFFFEDEEVIRAKGGIRMPPRRPAAARKAAPRREPSIEPRLLGEPRRKPWPSTRPWPPTRPWPRPINRYPIYFPVSPLPYQARGGSEYALWVQVSLNKALNLNLQTNGMMDAATRSAIRSFQRREGLPVTGVVGPDTEQALVAATRGAAARGGDQEISWLSSVWPGLMEFETAAAAPSLIRQERTPPGQTLYVNIPLGAEGPAKPMTGIFIPQSFRPTPKVDLIIYLHGMKPEKDLTLTVDRYWNRNYYPPWPLREGLNQSGKNFILVAPTLGPRSQTQTGWLAQPGGLDRYVDLVLAALATHGPYQGRRPQLGNLILACHSGGGLPMRQLAMGKNRYASHIKECWGFDCLYFTGDENLWAQWAKSRPDARLFIHYQSSTRERSEKLKQKNVPNISVSRSAAKGGHNWVPIHHWQERLAASLQTRAPGAAAQPGREWEQELVPEWLSRRDWSSIALRTKAVALANQELNRWGMGTIKESDPRLRSVIEDYWRSGAGYKPGGPNWWSAVPWSAAFISWLMRKAGAGADFKYSGGHAAYIAAAKQNRLANNNSPFKAYRVTEANPRVGDLVCKSRAGSGATYDNITPGMATHCDIVTAVEPNRLITVGGNVSNSVKQTPVRTDASGHINQPDYFAVIRVGA